MTVYEIETGVKMEALTRNKGSKYPFSKMFIGDSFFVESTEEKPRPWKSMGSTICWANRRFARKFKIRKEERTLDDGSTVLGARIFRVAENV